MLLMLKHVVENVMPAQHGTSKAHGERRVNCSKAYWGAACRQYGSIVGKMGSWVCRP